MAEADGFVPRLMAWSRTDDPTLVTEPLICEGGVHAFGAFATAVVTGLNTLAEIKSAAVWDIQAGVEETEFDEHVTWINTGNVSQKDRRRNQVEDVYRIAESRFPQYATPNEVRAKLRQLGMNLPDQ